MLNLVADLMKKVKGGGTEYNYDYDPQTQNYTLTGQEPVAKKKGGTVKANKSRGFRVSADGIAKKGKTRGRFV